MSEVGLINQRDFSVVNGAAQTNMNLLNQYQDKFAQLQNNVTVHLQTNPQFKLSTEEKQTVYDTAKRKSKPVYKLENSDFNTTDQVTADKFISYKQFAEAQLQSTNLSPVHKRYIEEVLESTGKIYEDVSFADMLSINYIDDYSGGVLPQQLQFTILQYHKLWRANETNLVLNEHRGQSLPALTVEEFETKHGRKPWEVINATLSSVEGFKYELDFDETTFESETQEIAIQFIKKGGSDTIKIPVTDLSSGEKTLVALVIALYSAASERKFPKLVLLDEIDATLHPSMATIFLELLQKNIVQELGVKVLLVTHSPSTVALAPETAIYTMHSDTADRLQKTAKQEALNQLTEGFVALTNEQSATNLKFTLKDAPKDLVFFEGGSDVAYIKHSDSVGGNGLSTEFEITYAGGTGQLDKFWSLISSSDTSSGYTHGMSATLVYDCDENRSYASFGQHGRWSMAQIGTNPIKKGVENLLRPEFIARAKAANPDYFDQIDGELTVNDAYKMNLAEWFQQNADAEDMAPFVSLAEEIKQKAKHSH